MEESRRVCVIEAKKREGIKTQGQIVVKIDEEKKMSIKRHTETGN